MLSASRLRSSLRDEWQVAVSRYPVNKIGKIRRILGDFMRAGTEKAGASPALHARRSAADQYRATTELGQLK
jgi:hypothetical protein